MSQGTLHIRTLSFRAMAFLDYDIRGILIIDMLIDFYRDSITVD